MELIVVYDFCGDDDSDDATRGKYNTKAEGELTAAAGIHPYFRTDN